jgi:hypothetical protein
MIGPGIHQPGASSVDVGAYLHHLMQESQWRISDLWVAALAIGGLMLHDDVDRITSSRRLPSQAEYGVLALALNEHFSELGLDHPVVGWDELTAPIV